MRKKQKEAVIGMILGDAYLQKTGVHNARIRLEHSIHQKEYITWKVGLLSNYFHSHIQILERENKVWGKTYTYVRAQSQASADFGKLRDIFYKDGSKIIPEQLPTLLQQPLSLAIWFMDDGYYYHRDKMSYIYIPNYEKQSIDILLFSLKKNFDLLPKVVQKKKGLVLVFTVQETKKLITIIEKFIIPSMSYKIPLDPVSTERNPSF